MLWLLLLVGCIVGGKEDSLICLKLSYIDEYHDQSMTFLLKVSWRQSFGYFERRTTCGFSGIKIIFWKHLFSSISSKATTHSPDTAPFIVWANLYSQSDGSVPTSPHPTATTSTTQLFASTCSFYSVSSSWLYSARSFSPAGTPPILPCNPTNTLIWEWWGSWTWDAVPRTSLGLTLFLGW